MQNYDHKPDEYFGRARTEILSLLPKHAPQVLEIGCGSGATLAWLKANGVVDHTTGIELAEHMASSARNNVDRLISGNAEELLDENAPGALYDLVLCLDVLEHLVDPWKMIRKIGHVLKPGGLVVCSIPNVRHFSVLLPLLLKGQWAYKEAGILDRTHLRFFTKSTAAKLIEEGGLALKEIKSNIHVGSKSDLLRMLSLGLLADFLSVQYLISAQK